MYDYLLGDVPNLREMMDEVNANNCSVVGICYASDTNQVIIVYDKPEEKPTIGFLRPEYDR